MEHLRLRLLVLVVLVTVGVGLAGAGGVLGLDDHLGTTGASGEVVVSEEDVSFVEDGDVRTVEQLSAGDQIDIYEQEDGILIETESPLGPAERERAVEIARNNATVGSFLARTDGELVVEPVPKTEVAVDPDPDEGAVGEAVDAEIDVHQGEERSDNESAEISVEIVEFETNESSVTIETDPSYREDKAKLRVYGDDEMPRFSVVVDLETEAVEQLTEVDDR